MVIMEGDLPPGDGTLEGLTRKRDICFHHETWQSPRPRAKEARAAQRLLTRVSPEEG